MSGLPEFRRLGAYQDRCDDCRKALEPIVDSVTRLALACGLTEDDVAYALLELARSNLVDLLNGRDS